MPIAQSLLIVSSVLASLDLLTRSFVHLGFSVTPVGHPRQALEAATLKPFDGVIVQNNLPEISGVELVRKLTRLVGDIPFILLCAPLNDQVETDAREAGVRFCLPAACDPRQIEQVVEDAIGDRSRLPHQFADSSTRSRDLKTSATK